MFDDEDESFWRADGQRCAHRGLGLTPPQPAYSAWAPETALTDARILRRDRLGGLLYEYVLAACD